MIRRVAAVGLAVLALAACSQTEAAESTTLAPTSSASPSTSTTSATSTSTTSTSTTSTSTTSTTVTPSTLSPSTLPPTTVAGRPADFLGEETIGTSAQGRPIVASHRGTAGGKVVLVVGVIHGDENDGLAIIGDLAQMPLPAGIDLWLLPLMNPDGYANDVRGNGNGVDLNRNFPHDWTPIAQPGDWQYSGSGPGSEPETQAYMAFTEHIRPRLTLWYHQDLFRVSPSNGPDGPLRKKYAELTGLSYDTISGPGSVYTGVAATWTRRSLPDAMSFIVELGPTLSTADAQVHARAVLTVAGMA
jgi:protein MpaA